MTVQPIIVTPDLDRLQRFYREVLGAEEVAREPAEGPAFFVGLEVLATPLGLVHDKDVRAGEPSRVLLSCTVDNVDATLERVEPAGGKVLGPPNDMPWGERVAHTQDPDGNTVNLTQPI
ncbi:VOC family protein [Saccharopolyspora hirsuta]|uniref:VOC family protein n=1 Tax=Saccharopolyspora hirsuta TaxID=1837 RepID=UPI00333057E8